MSALLKGAGGVATLPIARPVVPAPVADPRDATIAALEAEIEGLRTAAERAAAATARGIAAAREQGRAEMQRDDAARIALLDRAMTAAHTAFDDRLAQLDRLAPALARAAIERLFVPDADRPALVEGLIARRLSAFRRAAIVAVAVSPADFDGDALAGLTERIGVAVAHDAELGAGQCRIEARVESLALDVAVEWSAVAAALDAMAGDGA